MISRKIKKKWKPRAKTAHKGSFGRIFILAGARGFTGAAHLTAQGALRAGAGLITLGVPESVYPILAKKEAEVMVRPLPCNRAGTLSLKAFQEIKSLWANQDVLAIGPGMTQNRETQQLIRKTVLHARADTVVDADGLNAFQGKASLFKKARASLILTPHPGEFKRLFGGKLTAGDADRKKRAIEEAKRSRAVIVLKGHRSIVADPSGRVYFNQSGNPGMASGGTGDVLTGVIAALLGQGFSAWDASRFGVYLHGVAGDRAAKKVGEVSLTAGDILECLPAVIKKIRGC